MLTTCPIGDIIIKSPRARATKTAHSGNEIKQINNGAGCQHYFSSFLVFF